MDGVTEGVPTHLFLVALWGKEGGGCPCFSPVDGGRFVVWMYATIFFSMIMKIFTT